jgi:hypothetical protein
LASAGEGVWVAMCVRMAWRERERRGQGHDEAEGYGKRRRGREWPDLGLTAS